MGRNIRVIHEDENFQITKFTGGGRREPTGVEIKLNPNNRYPGNKSDRLKITIDDLFNLTEVLDDICDQIEDQTYGGIHSQHHSHSSSRH